MLRRVAPHPLHAESMYPRLHQHQRRMTTQYRRRLVQTLRQANIPLVLTRSEDDSSASTESAMLSSYASCYHLELLCFEN